MAHVFFPQKGRKQILKTAGKLNVSFINYVLGFCNRYF